MFFAHSSSILFTVLTVIAAGAAAFFVPMLVKKVGANKYFSQTSIDIVVGLLAAYAIIGLITLLAGLLVWLGNLGPLGYDEYRW